MLDVTTPEEWPSESQSVLIQMREMLKALDIKIDSKFMVLTDRMDFGDRTAATRIDGMTERLKAIETDFKSFVDTTTKLENRMGLIEQWKGTVTETTEQWRKQVDKDVDKVSKDTERQFTILADNRKWAVGTLLAIIALAIAVAPLIIAHLR